VIGEIRRVALETGATTTVECWGDAGPAILCVHGLGSSRRDFARLGEALASTHRVFAYDQRGHGDATGGDGAMALSVLAQDLRAVADSIGTVAVVVGHSLGGAVALIDGKKVARALVLVDPVLRMPGGVFEREYVSELAVLLAETGEARERAIRAAFADAVPSDREAKVHAMAHLEIETVRRLGRDNDVENGGWDVRALLSDVKVPTTILVAGTDSVIAPDDLAQAGPLVTIVRVADHGHSLHRSAFDRFVDAVTAAA
jgi:pimeloyl-ACP methyl ester carboxylesterase